MISSVFINFDDSRDGVSDAILGLIIKTLDEFADVYARSSEDWTEGLPWDSFAPGDL